MPRFQEGAWAHHLTGFDGPSTPTAHSHQLYSLLPPRAHSSHGGCAGLLSPFSPGSTHLPNCCWPRLILHGPALTLSRGVQDSPSCLSAPYRPQLHHTESMHVPAFVQAVCPLPTLQALPDKLLNTLQVSVDRHTPFPLGHLS